MYIPAFVIVGAGGSSTSDHVTRSGLLRKVKVYPGVDPVTVVGFEIHHQRPKYPDPGPRSITSAFPVFSVSFAEIVLSAVRSMLLTSICGTPKLIRNSSARMRAAECPCAGWTARGVTPK